MANVGFWWSEKKTQRFNQQELELKLSAIGFNLIRIDLDQDLAVQGPFVAIIHKLSETLITADSGDEKAHQIIKKFEAFVTNVNPHVLFIDPQPNFRKLKCHKQYNIIKELLLADKIKLAFEGFFTPTFLKFMGKDPINNWQKLIANDVKFPFVCKPLEAHGGSFDHQMSLIKEKGLKDINPPCGKQSHEEYIKMLPMNTMNEIQRDFMRNMICSRKPMDYNLLAAAINNFGSSVGELSLKEVLIAFKSFLHYFFWNYSDQTLHRHLRFLMDDVSAKIALFEIQQQQILVPVNLQELQESSPSE